MNRTHRLDLSKKVERGTHVTNQNITIEAQVDVDSDIFTSVPIPFCKKDKIVPMDKGEPFYVSNLNELVKKFDKITITKLNT